MACGLSFADDVFELEAREGAVAARYDVGLGNTPLQCSAQSAASLWLSFAISVRSTA
jgi:hypothetical protein